jgi:hypothetical protein
MMKPEETERFPKNVEGPFFVVNGECIACMAPEHAAPDLMAFDQEASHCYFKKQPVTPDEFERAARAVWVSCCGAVRYAGDDPAVHRRIAELHEENIKRMRQQQKKPWWRFWQVADIDNCSLFIERRRRQRLHTF